MAEIMFTNGRSKGEMFDDNELTLKPEYFDTKSDEPPTDSSDIFFGAETAEFAPTSDAYGDLFLMDPNDFLGMREEVIGNDSGKPAEEIPVPVKSEGPEIPTEAPRRSTRRKKLKQKQFRKVSTVVEDRDSSDLEDFSIPLTVNQPILVKPEHPEFVHNRIPPTVDSSSSFSNGIRPRILKINRAIPLCNTSRPIQNGVIATRRILAIKGNPTHGRQLLPRS